MTLSTSKVSDPISDKYSLLVFTVLVALSCPKALYHLRSDNIFRITIVVADWLD